MVQDDASESIVGNPSVCDWIVGLCLRLNYWCGGSYRLNWSWGWLTDDRIWLAESAKCSKRSWWYTRKIKSQQWTLKHSLLLFVILMQRIFLGIELNMGGLTSKHKEDKNYASKYSAERWWQKTSHEYSWARFKKYWILRQYNNPKVKMRFISAAQNNFHSFPPK